jgi:glycosyltransferase involved in cell wall biosynthesis
MYDNLEVFITTYSRAQMLNKTLISICEQSAVGFDIIIVDNASTDETKDIVENVVLKYPERNITFVPSEINIGGTNNINRARMMAKKQWAMLFHDDDLMHPEYIKTAMDLLKQNPDAAMASCTYTPSPEPTMENWETFSNQANIAAVKDFAALMFTGTAQNFASTIYKTELMQTGEIKNKIYGKMWDRPFMLDLAKSGKTIILKDPYIRYRVHEGQDTNTSESGPFAPEYFALLNCYKEILGNNWLNKYGKIYNSFIHAQLKIGYRWMKSVNEKMTFKEFKKQAAESDVIKNCETLKIVEKIYKIIGYFCQKAPCFCKCIGGLK